MVDSEMVLFEWLGAAGTPLCKCCRARSADQPAELLELGPPADARAAADLTDGVVVGSRALEVAEYGPGALRDYVRSLRDALD